MTPPACMTTRYPPQPQSSQARLRYSGHGPPKSRAGPPACADRTRRPCRAWGNFLRTGETVAYPHSAARFTARWMELVLTRHVATAAAIAALLGPVGLAHAQPDHERQEM